MIKEDSKRIAITLDNEMLSWIESIYIDTQTNNMTQLVKYLILNYLQFKYDFVPIEYEQLKEYLEKNGRKQMRREITEEEYQEKHFK